MLIMKNSPTDTQDHRPVTLQQRGKRCFIALGKELFQQASIGLAFRLRPRNEGAESPKKHIHCIRWHWPVSYTSENHLSIVPECCLFGMANFQISTEFIPLIGVGRKDCPRTFRHSFGLFISEEIGESGNRVNSSISAHRAKSVKSVKSDVVLRQHRKTKEKRDFPA
jgi:hypothetical protein